MIAANAMACRRCGPFSTALRLSRSGFVAMLVIAVLFVLSQRWAALARNEPRARPGRARAWRRRAAVTNERVRPVRSGK